MSLQEITLMEAYIIENLRKNGVSDEEIVRVDDKLIDEWKALDDRYDYTLFKKLKEDMGDRFPAIVREGYRVKFLTINGLINLIELKIGKKRDVDFTVHEDGVSGLKVNEEELKVIEQILSLNWQVQKEGERISIRSKHTNRYFTKNEST